MGRAYGVEMDEVPDTITAALAKVLAEADVDEFRGVIAHPLVAVGVGGSMTAAHFAARLHREAVGLPARVATTLEFTREGPLQDEAALLVSAGGKNKDALAAYDVAEQFAREVAIWTVNPTAPLGEKARAAGFPFLFDASTAVYKDGFLATNTLLSTLMLGGGLYDAACHAPPPQTQPLADLAAGLPERRKALRNELRDWAEKDSILVLHSGWGSVGAADLETRLHESALAHVQVADLRNFAHGRHLWLAERGEDTAIVAFVSNGDLALYKRLARLLPDACPIHAVTSGRQDWTVAVDFVVESMLLTELLGEARNRDPGRPSVPEWGRKTYSLGPGPSVTTRRGKRPHHHLRHVTTATDDSKNARATIARADVRAVVLDLDGTLLERREKKGSPAPALFDELNRLLREGVTIGLASGRGKSLYTSVHAHFDKAFHDKIIIGFYEGAIIQRLSDGPLPDIPKQTQGVLAKLLEHLEGAQGVPPWFEVEPRPMHVGISAVNPGDARRISDVVEAIIMREGLAVSFGASSLGLDVYLGGVSKLRVIEEAAKQAGCCPDQVLRIGDRGDRGGNDYEMLNHPLGLSVNLTHAALMTCQNLAPPGIRGPRAALYYLQHLRPGKNGHKLALPEED